MFYFYWPLLYCVNLLRAKLQFHIGRESGKARGLCDMKLVCKISGREQIDAAIRKMKAMLQDASFNLI